MATARKDSLNTEDPMDKTKMSMMEGASATCSKVFEFPGFCENIAVHPNDNILVTCCTSPCVRTFRPGRQDEPMTQPEIPGANGVSGIVEVSPNVFAVAAGMWDGPTRRMCNGAIWTLDFTRAQSAKNPGPAMTKIMDIPEACCLNGMCLVPNTSVVLVAESALGKVYAIDMKKMTCSVAVMDPALMPVDPPPALGVNGIACHGQYMYFVNSNTGMYGRFPMDRKTGKAMGDMEMMCEFGKGTNTHAIDDFTMDKEGNAYIAYHPNTICKVDPSGKKMDIVSGEQLMNPTSVAFSRGTPQKETMLYVSGNKFGKDGCTGGVMAVDLMSMNMGG